MSCERGRHLVAAKPRKSVVVCGPPGSGKTSAFAIPNLLEWDGPAVVCSVTSEILSTTLPDGSTPISWSPNRPLGTPGSRFATSNLSWLTYTIIDRLGRAVRYNVVHPPRRKSDDSEASSADGREERQVR
jgi:hypothetical protein